MLYVLPVVPVYVNGVNPDLTMVSPDLTVAYIESALPPVVYAFTVSWFCAAWAGITKADIRRVAENIDARAAQVTLVVRLRTFILLCPKFRKFCTL